MFRLTSQKFEKKIIILKVLVVCVDLVKQKFPACDHHKSSPPESSLLRCFSTNSQNFRECANQSLLTKILNLRSCQY